MIDVDKLLRALGISAKRAGREWQALCPYHADRKPSWSIRDQPGHERHGRHNCFSCGAGGDAVQLVADLLTLEREEALQWLAQSGITSDPDVPFETEIVERAQPLFSDSALHIPALVQFEPLDQWVSAARDFAIRRGLTAEQVERWGIGYAVAGRCRGRIWIPVRDGDGKLQSWMARAYDAKMRLRYLTPTREEALGLAALFGPQHWGHRGQVVLCEGALNALACERAGARNIAAIGGSATKVTPLVIAALSTFEQVLVVTDPDAAGDKAAEQVIGALKRWRSVIRLELPAGTDANDLPEAELREILTGRWPA